MSRQLFVAGTDTDIGKTLLAGILTAGLRASYWKPIQSGRDPRTDSERIAAWLGPEPVLPERYLLDQPLSPNQSAERQGATIELDQIVLPEVAGPLVVEGAGGLLVPLNQQHTMLDLIVQLGLPVVLAARAGLGTINHSLLSLQALRQAGARVLGVVYMGGDLPLNRRDIQHFGRVHTIGVVPWLDPIRPDQFADIFATFSWPEF